MKKILLLIAFLMSMIGTQAQKGYYYGSKFIELKADNTKGNCVIPSASYSLQKTKTASTYFSKVYYVNNSGPIFVLPKVIIKLEEGKSINDITGLFQKEISVAKHFENTYYCDCKVNSSEEVLSIVGKLAKQDGVVWVEPDMYSGALTKASDNPLYYRQYYLRNTGYFGTAGIDINAEPAWQMVAGNPSITVAVIDSGVDLNHEDLSSAILPGYTVGNTTGYGAPQNWNGDDKAHGTNCAGIIGAIDNNIGIKGIASGVKILPVNIIQKPGDDLYRGLAENSEIATAIRWAYPKSDILSCSWKCFVESNDIRDAIGEARTKGRNGKGCVVVFAAGNATSAIDFPANVEGVITVGAINERGLVTSYSNYGEEMDFVAPGENITTTNTTAISGDDTNKYTYEFNGTSAACPQVAGVAALMLSVNPKLSEFDVKEILQETARDLGPKGWDKDYGYGLVDAAKAVASSYIERLAIVGPSTVIDNDFYSIDNLPNGCKVQWSQRNISSTLSSMAVLEADEPDKNVVTLTNLYGFQIALTARIEFPGGFVYELSRNISGPTPTISATYFEVYSDGSKSLSTPLLPDTYGEVNMVTPPNDIVVISDCFIGRQVTYRYSDSNHPGADRVLHVDGDRFIFEMPSLKNGQTLDFTVWYNNSYPLYTFKFGANVQARNNVSCMTPIGNNKYRLNVDLNSANQVQQLNTTPYKIDVFDMQKNLAKSLIATETQNYILNLSDLAKGLYVVVVETDGKKYSQKINVK